MVLPEAHRRGVLQSGVQEFPDGRIRRLHDLAGAVSYLVGTFLVTGLGNVPLNNKLAAVVSTDSAAVAVWEDYLRRWTRLNTLRTVAAIAAALMLIVGLISKVNA